MNVTLNSVVFCSFGQELTTAGGYIEVASRITELAFPSAHPHGAWAGTPCEECNEDTYGQRTHRFQQPGHTVPSFSGAPIWSVGGGYGRLDRDGLCLAACAVEFGARKIVTVSAYHQHEPTKFLWTARHSERNGPRALARFNGVASDLRQEDEVLFAGELSRVVRPVAGRADLPDAGGRSPRIPWFTVSWAGPPS
ncbi:hypothetical protein ACWDRZ_30430 [Streptomyces sp. NPDC003509]